MPTGQITIEWSNPPGTYGVLVEYRKASQSSWTKPTTPDNPTMDGSYPLTIDTNTDYYVRISSVGKNCVSGYIIRSIKIPVNGCCPPTYTLSPDATYCYKVQQVAATPPSAGANAVAVTNAAYTTCGSYIYQPGYNINGTGTSTRITLANAFWVNGAGTCVNSTTTDGPLNRTGLWAPSFSNGQDIGFGVCVTINESKTYYVGIGCDNYGIIKVDGVTIVQQDPAALDIQYPTVGANTVPFRIWHIYPITLTAGPHFIEILGHNVSGPAAIGCEIYDATSAELQAATSYAALGSKLIFSSKDYIGDPIQIDSTGSAGYTCPATYSLASCENPPVCRKVLTTSTISC